MMNSTGWSTPARSASETVVGLTNKLRPAVITRTEDKKLDPFDRENLDIGSETGHRQPLQWQHLPAY